MFHPTTETSFRAAERDYLTDRRGAERVARCARCGCESTDLDWAGRCPGEACALASRIDAGEAALADASEADRDAWMRVTLCDECGRHMADARSPICSCCAASWWTPGVTVPRADHEGPRPEVFDGAASLAGEVAA